MLLPVENILEGTWASGTPPDEWIDYQLMRGMGWSWRDLDCAPRYVRQYCIDFLLMEAAARAQPKKG